MSDLAEPFVWAKKNGASHFTAGRRDQKESYFQTLY